MPAADVGVEFRLANALEGALPQLQNLRRAFSGALYVMTEERLYRVDDQLEAVDFAEFWNSVR